MKKAQLFGLFSNDGNCYVLHRNRKAQYVHLAFWEIIDFPKMSRIADGYFITVAVLGGVCGAGADSGFGLVGGVAVYSFVDSWLV